MLLAAWTLALVAASSPEEVMCGGLWPDDKAVAASPSEVLNEATIQVGGDVTVIDLRVKARVWRTPTGTLIALEAPVTAVLDEGLLSLPVGSQLFVYPHTTLVKAPGARLNGHRVKPAFRLSATRVGLAAHGLGAGRLDCVLFLDPIEIAGWRIDEYRSSRTVVLASPTTHQGVTLPAGTTVTNLTRMGELLSAALPAGADGSVVAHHWVRRPPLDLHLTVTHRASPTNTFESTLSVTHEGQTRSKRGVARTGWDDVTFEWTAEGAGGPQTFALQFWTSGHPQFTLSGPLAGADGCAHVTWNGFELECLPPGPTSVVPRGRQPASFAAALNARLDAREVTAMPPPSSPR